MVSPILPKNELENSNFCPSLLGQNFFVSFLGEWKKDKMSFCNLLTFSENNNKQKNKTSWLVIKFKCQNSKLVVGSIEQLTYQEPQPDIIDWYMIWLHLIYLVWVLYKPVKLNKFPAVKKHYKSKQLQKNNKKYIYHWL